MFEVEVVRTIDASASKVWALVGDPLTHPRWRRELVEIEHVAGPAAQPGGRYREVVQVLGRPAASVIELTTVAPGKRLEFQVIEPDWLESRNRLLVEKLGGGTRLTLTSSNELSGWWRLAQPVLRRIWERSMAAELAHLAALLEGRAQPAT